VNIRHAPHRAVEEKSDGTIGIISGIGFDFQRVAFCSPSQPWRSGYRFRSFIGTWNAI